MKNLLLSTLVFCLYFSVLSQRGIHGNYTVNALNSVLNSYTILTANATSGQSAVTVSSNTMNGGFFTSNLAPGDLILIIQMQGAQLNVDTYAANEYVTSGGLYWGPFTTPIGHLIDWPTFIPLWGEIYAYNNAGKFELAEVKSLTGTTTINLMCPLTNTYTSTGHVQIVRIPRFQNLTINSNASAVPSLWNGNTGGIVAMEVNGNLILNANGKISSSSSGFRGGVTDNQTLGSPPGNVNDVGFCASHVATQGAEKGEGIAGFYTEYDAIYSRYCKGAPANGGGGGGNHNAGGGGGSNIGNTVLTYSGKGVPNTTYNTNWNLEAVGMGGSSSPGGGRGGYSGSTVDQNENTVGPNVTSWSGDYRRKEGGLGGHPLLLDNTRIFTGGGGGAGDQNNTQGGGGGRGGGITFLKVYGTISGSGTIEANGANGINANPNGQTAVSTSTQKYGNDGAGGGGGGGAIYISNASPVPNTITLAANGGNGGNQVLSVGLFATSPTMEADGPGGGGTGGFISLTSGTAIQQFSGGISGTTNSAHVPNFPPNGATAGSSGQANTNTSFFDILASDDTLCAGGSVTLTASTIGNPPTGILTWYNSPFGNTVVGTGNSFTTPVLNATTTYYIGICPSSFRKPVTVYVGANPTISGIPTIVNATCNSPGSISGLTINGGTLPYSYSWSNNGGNNAGINNAPAGTYSLTVFDALGCTSTSIPYTVTGTNGPVLDETNAQITPEICNGTLGSINGLSVLGNNITYSWSNSSNTTINPNNLVAGTYVLIVTDLNGCTDTSLSYTIPFTSGPTVNISSLIVGNENCGQQNGLISGITASGVGLQFLWSPNNSTVLNPQNLGAGSYTLVVTDTNGCTANAGPITVSGSPTPQIDISNLILQNENCGQNNGSISGITINGGLAPLTYEWNNQPNSLNLSNLAAGNYSLVVTDAAGCMDSIGPLNITTNGGPVIDTSNLIIVPVGCDGSLGGISGITTTGNGLVYNWSNNQNSIDNPNLSAGNYTLVVTDVNNCSSSMNLTVPQNIPISINETAVNLVQPTCLILGSITGITVNGGTSNFLYSWSPGNQNSSSLLNASAGTYQLIVVDAVNGCSDTSLVYTLNQPTYPIAAINFNPTDPDVAETITFINASNNYILEQWNIGGIIYNSSPIDTSFQAGIYPVTLIVTNAQGCIDTITIMVTVYDELTFPNVITPNGDNVNDAMLIEALKPNSSVSVMNRWGNIVFESTNYQNNWDGKDQTGKELTAGVYTVIFTDPDLKTQYFFVHLFK